MYNIQSSTLNTQCELLDKTHEEQKIAVTEAQKALQKAKDRREEMEREIDRMRDEIAAWYNYMHHMHTLLEIHVATCMLQVSTCMLTPLQARSATVQKSPACLA